MVELRYISGALVFFCTVIAYATLLYLGKRWRNTFQSDGEDYWKSSKESRIQELTSTVWRPRLIMIFYGLSYFTNGFTRIAFSIWIPFFLLQVRGLETLDAAFFVGVIYAPWGWKMFLGLFADALPINFRGGIYRRLPWFLVAGVLYLVGSLIFILYDPEIMPIWSLLLPTFVMVVGAGAVFDLSADSYAVDATPPDWHGRVLGTSSRIGRAIGGAMASIIPPFLIKMGGYRLVFLVASLTGIFAFFSLLLKEPPFEQERVFNKKAIAFTFTEKTVILGCFTTFLYAFSLKPIASPLGGMYAFILEDVVGMKPEYIGTISLATILSGIPGSILGGWAADKWGHRKLFVISGIAFALSGLLWANLGKQMAVWFIFTALIISFLCTFNLACLLALMGDITPFALSSTVYQMYMSFIWIGNIPVSLLIGYLLTKNFNLLLYSMIFFTIVMSIVGWYIKSFRVGKAIQI